jgi:hypothetical protein
VQIDKFESEVEALTSRKKKLDRDVCFPFNFCSVFQSPAVLFYFVCNVVRGALVVKVN